MQRHGDIMRSKYNAALTSGLAILGIMAATGCLQLNAEHCVAKGGDRECIADGATSMVCTMSLGAEPETSLDGCMGEVLPGFAHVKYGLPKDIGRPGDEGYETVWGRLDVCGVAQNEIASKIADVSDEFDLLYDEVLNELDGHSRVRVGSVAFDENIFGQFNNAMDNACDVPGTDTDSGADTSTSTDVGTDTGGTSSTTSMSDASESSTTGGECTHDRDCSDATTPFCNEDGRCMSCDGMRDPNGACADADPMKPLCLGETCVACTQEDHSVCDQQLLVCDSTTSLCLPCKEHDQCTSGACDIFVGMCFDPARVVEVGEGGVPNIALGLAALEWMGPDVLDGRRGVLVLHKGMKDFDETIDLGGDEEGVEAIALVAAPGERPIWSYTNMMSESTTLTIRDTTRAYLDGVTLRGNAGGLVGKGLSCVGGRVDIRRSRIVANMGGGIQAQGSCELYVENSFIGTDADDRDALLIFDEEVTTTILYSTLGAGDGIAKALHCTEAASVDVRNSLLVARTLDEEVECPSAVLTDSAWESEDEGLGDMSTNWFEDYVNGNYHLTAIAPDGIRVADWQYDDPSTDIDGDHRITADGMADHAGADVP